MPRTAKGHRPHFFDDPNVDKLLAMLMALAGEVSVLRERLDTHERLAAEKKWASEGNVEKYAPSAEIMASREAWRADYLARILRIVSDELEAMSSRDAEKDFQRVVKRVSR